MSLEDLILLQTPNSAAYAGNRSEPTRLTDCQFINELIGHLQTEIDRLVKLIEPATSHTS